MTKAIINTGILVISLISLFLIGEIMHRIYHKFVRDIPFTASTKMFHDQELGWKGKKIFGDTATKKYKIFVIGDSFTQGYGIAEKDMYYSAIGEELNAEIFVYAAGGYGTLQEYMVIDRYFDEIKPDLVILQTSDNDFINNLWELESASFFNNNLMVRPYLINGRIEYRFPKFPGRLRIFLSAHSRLFYSLANRMDILFAKLAKMGFLQSVEKHISEKGINFDKFKKAITVTDDLMAKIKTRVGKTQVAAFSVSGEKYFKVIFQKNNIEFLGDMEERIKKEEARIGKMRLKDSAHWNEKGHQVAGQTLIEELQKRGYAKKAGEV